MEASLKESLAQADRLSKFNILQAKANQIFANGGCKQELPKIPSCQLQPCHDSVQVDDLSVGVKGVTPPPA